MNYSCLSPEQVLDSKDPLCSAVLSWWSYLWQAALRTATADLESFIFSRCLLLRKIETILHQSKGWWHFPNYEGMVCCVPKRLTCPLLYGVSIPGMEAIQISPGKLEGSRWQRQEYFLGRCSWPCSLLNRVKTDNKSHGTHLHTTDGGGLEQRRLLKFHHVAASPDGV